MAANDLDRLNALFIALHRSLLQYVGECWPWVSDDGQQTEVVSAIRKAVTVQKQDESLLADYLNEAGWIINFGGYPTQFTDLHYVSLTYLIKQMVNSQSDIVKALESATAALPENQLLTTILGHERDILKTVQGLAAPRPQLATAS